MTFELKVTPVTDGNMKISSNTVEGINEAGTMALCRAEYAPNHAPGSFHVFGRGIRADGTSCIFEGELDGTSLVVGRVVVSPETHPTTKLGEEVIGYEDPTPLFFNDGVCAQLLCSRAFRSESGGICADTVKLGPTYPAAKFSPDRVDEYLSLSTVQHELELYGYSEIDLAKEVNQLSGNRIVFEIGGKLGGLSKKSRIVAGKRIGFEPFEKYGSYEPFLEPTTGTWYSNHVSTGSNALYLQIRLRVMVFNGAHLAEFDGKMRNTWSFGLMAIDRSDRPFWISAEPICTPPKGVEPGLGGQLIAFASDAWLETDGDGWILSVLYHAMDRFSCLSKYRVELITSENF